MKNEITELKEYVARLRADLIATNMTVQCVMTAMPPAEQQQALKALAELSAMQEQSAEKSQMPEVQKTMQLVGQAVERAYQGLQGAYKMRMNKLRQGAPGADL